jgi:cytochrome b
MNTANASVSQDDAASKADGVVWDLPTRLFHWSLAVCFAGAWLTSDSERQHLLHLLFGYSLFGLIAFRIVWGFVGSRYARFSNFAYGPSATLRYMATMAKGKPDRHVGHNPAGAVAIWLLLSLGLATAGVGLTMVAGGSESLEEVHEALATAMLVVVGLHVLGVIVGSVLHRENLPRAMVTGRKTGLRTEDAIAKRSIAIGLLLFVALAAFWATGLAQQRPPLGLPGGDASAESEREAGEGVGRERESKEENERGERDDD